MRTTSIMIVGVGGQGTLLASRILGNAVISRGYDVKVSEVHGMSQRGGSVVTYVRFGERVYSPIIDAGEADIILAFERLEAYRYLPYLKKGGKIIMNAQQIDPMPVIIGAAKYPEGITEKIAAVADLTEIDAQQIAEQLGNSRVANVVLIGVLAKSTDIPYEVWRDVITETVPKKALQVNLEAFDKGYLGA